MSNNLNDLKGIEVVSLDNWQTILIPHRLTRKQRAQSLKEYLGLKCDLETIETTLTLANTMLDNISLTTGKHYGVSTRVMSFNMLLPDEIRIGGLSEETAAGFSSYSAAQLKTHPPVLFEEDIRDTLQKLSSAGLKIVLCSNTGFVDGVFIRELFEELDIKKYFNFFVFSNEIGWVKPSPRIFAYLSIMTYTSPQKILHIGDSYEEDYLGAKKSGLRALHLCPKGNPGTDSVSRIKNLIDLLAI